MHLLSPVGQPNVGPACCGRRTCNAGVAGLQVGGQVFWTRLDDVPKRGNRQLTPPLTGTGAIEDVDDVSRAADVTVVTCHAPAEMQSSVPGVGHEDHVTAVTGSVEALELAVLFRPN